jgi:hypothetical protein
MKILLHITCHNSTVFVNQIKNLIIGNNKFKTVYLQDGIINKLVDIVNNNHENTRLVREALVTLCSFTKGNEVHKQRLTNHHRLHEMLLAYVCLVDYSRAESLQVIETCLKCLRNLYTPESQAKILSKNLIGYLYADLNRIRVILKMFSLSSTCRESIIDLFSNTCYFKEYQNLLVDLGAIQLFPCLLMSKSISVQLSVLSFYALVTYNNNESCRILTSESNLCQQIGNFELS